MTTLNQMTKNFPKQAKEVFESAYKHLVDRAILDGFTIEQSNRIAFDILVKEKGIFNLI